MVKQVTFEGLQVELFQDIDDPVATAEGENLMSQMRLAESQLAADLAGTGMPEFEREAVNMAPAKAELDSSSSTADDNRHVFSFRTLQSCHCKHFQSKHDSTGAGSHVSLTV